MVIAMGARKNLKRNEQPRDLAFLGQLQREVKYLNQRKSK